MLDLIKKLLGINSHTNKNYDENNKPLIVDLEQMPIIENTKSDANPFLNTKLHLDYHLQKMANDNKSLKIQRNILLALLLMCIGGLIYLGGQTKKEAIITLVDEKGQRIQPINLREMKDTQQRDRIITKIIEETLINLRTVTPDKNLQYELGKRALINVRKGSQAYTVIVNTLKEGNPTGPYVVGQK